MLCGPHLRGRALQESGSVRRPRALSRLRCHFPTDNNNSLLDTTFDTDGKLTTAFNSYGDLTAIYVQPDGKLLAIGSGDNGVDSDLVMARYNDNGALDSTFDTDGKLFIDPGGSEGAYKAARQEDGRWLILGYSGELYRLERDGAIDTSFGTSGVVTLTAGVTHAGVSWARGNAYVVGYDGSGATYDFAVSTYHAGLSERVYYQQDANHNVTSITDESGTVLERFVYTPYGQRTVLAANFTGTSDAYSLLQGHQGGRYDAVTGLYNFRMRDYDPSMGTWMEADPIGYPDGASRYEYETSGPTVWQDASGLAVGHHIVVEEIWRDWPASPGRDVFNRLTTGALEGGHGWSAAHAAYSSEVKSMWEAFKKAHGISPSSLSAKKAYEFFQQVVACKSPAVRGYLTKYIIPNLQMGLIKDFNKALAQAERIITKEGPSVLRKRGGKAMAKTLVKGALKRGLPIISIGFILADFRSNGAAYAARNAIIPADAIQEALQELSGEFGEWVDNANECVINKRWANAGIDVTTLKPNDPQDRMLDLKHDHESSNSFFSDMFQEIDDMLLLTEAKMAAAKP